MEKLYNTIEKYLRGKLPETEQRAFAERLEQESELREEVDAFRVSQDVIEQGIADNLRGDFAAWDKEQSPEKSAKIVAFRSMRRMIAVAACLLLIAFSFMQWNSARQLYNSEALAAHYHNVDLGTTRSAAGTANELSPALAAMQDKNYRLAVQELSKIRATSAFYPEARFYMADVYYKTDQLNEANEALEPVLAAQDVLLKEKAEWLKLLIALKDGKKNDADFQLLLDQISNNPAHSFQPSAAMLSETLDGFWVKWVK